VKDKVNLEVIISGCLNNERRAQEKLFQLFYGKMLPVCLRYISDKDSAQEALQEGFIKVFKKLELFDNKGSLEAWIRRIVSNTAIDQIRKSKKDPFLTGNDTDFVLESTDYMEEMESLETMELKGEIAIQAIQMLSPGYRAVFNLHVLEEYTHREISEILGISEGTSKSNFAKAKIKLQKILREKLIELV
jgi:RNA polymerase sigma-70 factor (ECF subfamily)